MKDNTCYTDSLKNDANDYFERNKSDEYFTKVREEYSFVNNFLEQDDSILEVGCGDGKNVFTFTSATSVKYVGVDLSDKAIDCAKKQFPECEFKVVEGVKLPFEDNSFDVVYLGFFLYLLDRRKLSHLVAEVDRVLKDRSLLVLTDFDVRYPYNNRYEHNEELKVQKYNYAKIFDAYPQYSLVEKRNHFESGFNSDHETWVSTSVLSKDIDPYLNKDEEGKFVR